MMASTPKMHMSRQQVISKVSGQSGRQFKATATVLAEAILGGRFGYFIFLLLGEGEGEVRGAGRGGVLVFIENPLGGGLQEGESRGGGAEGPGGCLQRIGELGGGSNGAEMPTKHYSNISKPVVW